MVIFNENTSLPPVCVTNEINGSLTNQLQCEECTVPSSKVGNTRTQWQTNSKMYATKFPELYCMCQRETSSVNIE